MALKHLNNIRGLQDPLKQSQAEFIISDIPALFLATQTQKIAGLLSGNSACATSEELRLRATSFSYPTPKIKQSELVIGGHIRKRGTIQDKSGQWKCRVTEQQDGGVLNIIQAWCDLIHNNITGMRLPSALYVGSCQVLLGGDVMQDQRKVWLKGFYPIGYNVNDIDPSSSAPVDVDITFNYDYFSESSYSLLSLF